MAARNVLLSANSREILKEKLDRTGVIFNLVVTDPVFDSIAPVAPFAVLSDGVPASTTPGTTDDKRGQGFVISVLSGPLYVTGAAAARSWHGLVNATTGSPMLGILELFDQTPEAKPPKAGATEP